MVRRLLSERVNGPARILDPCVGPHTFPQQIVSCGLSHPDDTFTLVDLDEEMITNSKQWASAAGCKADFIGSDYLDIPMDNTYDYSVLNPPYIRQEWLDRKKSYQELFRVRYDLNVPGTSNLYVYFMVKAVRDLKSGGKFACIVYDSWQSTKYGQWLWDFINKECDQLDIMSAPQQPFHGRLIDATLIFARKSDPSKRSNQCASVVQSRTNISKDLLGIEGFSSIGEIYHTKRGLRLKQADFFLCNLTTSSGLGATPFIKKVAKVDGFAVPDEHPEAALLLTSANENPSILSELKKRLSFAKKKPDENISILTWFKERPHSWMLHQTAPYAPILFNYYIRNRPRHIYNPKRFYSDNFYGLLMPNGVSPFACLATLNSTIVCGEILARARNQGNGLAKIQLYEYRDVIVPNLTKLPKKDVAALDRLGRELVERHERAEHIVVKIDTLIADIFAEPRLAPKRVRKFFSRADLNARRPKETRSCLG
jgi:adenine-specific DNA-methyltransferase